MRRLMELETKHQTLLKHDEDIKYNAEKYGNELQDIDGKIEWANDSVKAKFNNLNDVRGDYQGSSDSKDISLEVEKLKTKYLLNAIR